MQKCIQGPMTKNTVENPPQNHIMQISSTKQQNTQLYKFNESIKLN